MKCSILALLIFPLLAFAGTEEQQILFSQHDMAETYTPGATSQPTLADLLTIEPSTSIFYTYAREVELSELFADVTAKITVLAPSNKAVMALARKPHLGPKPVDETIVISEQEFDEQTRKNVQRWVAAHIIPEAPISLPCSKTYPTMLETRSIQFNEIDGKADLPAWARTAIEGDIHVTAMKEAINGVLFVVDGTIKTD